MPEAATHAMGEFATAAVGETYTAIDAATHAMIEAVAEFAVPAIILNPAVGWGCPLCDVRWTTDDCVSGGVEANGRFELPAV